MKKFTIETERLLIRPPQESDAYELNQAIKRSLNELQRWMPWAKDPSLSTTKNYIVDGIEQWESKVQSDFPMIVLYKEENKIISASGYNSSSNVEVPFYEVGYWLDSSYTGRGFATELTSALTQCALSHLNAVRVQIKTQKKNIKSQNVAKRCGFEIEAILKKHCIDCLTGKPDDDFIFSLFNQSDLKLNTDIVITSY